MSSLNRKLILNHLFTGQSNLAIVVISMFIFTVLQCSQAIQTPDLKQAKQKDIYKRSIVFDIKTPKVFYCPQEKQADFGKMIVKAKPLDKLCEFEGKVKPKSTPSDCYNDLDETDYACDEKRRFMVSIVE